MNVVRLLGLASTLVVAGCGKSEAPAPPAASTAPAPEPTDVIDRRGMLEAQLASAAKMAREGKLEAAIRQIEVSQQVFPGIPALEDLRQSLIRRRNAAIGRQLTEKIIINRHQLPPADRIAFSLLTTDWNATHPSQSGPATAVLTEDLRQRVADFIDRYPDFVEGRLLQARLGLKLQDRHDQLLKARAIPADKAPPSEGPEAGAKLAQWKLEQITRASPEFQELIKRLKEHGWYHEPSDHPTQPAPAPSGDTLARIRAALGRDPETAP